MGQKGLYTWPDQSEGVQGEGQNKERLKDREADSGLSSQGEAEQFSTSHSPSLSPYFPLSHPIFL